MSALLLKNAKAHHDYSLGRTFLTGIVLSGGEVKSLRLKSGSLSGSYVKLMGGEAFLLNAQITPYKFADNSDYDPKRTRKLLLRKKEILDLESALQTKGTALIPVAFVAAGRHIKLEIAVGKGKKEFEKRAALRQRDIERDIRRQFKDKIRLR
jgi:SsrA-binding protein